MSEEQLVHWADARGFDLTPENRPVVASYLRRARLLAAQLRSRTQLLHQLCDHYGVDAALIEPVLAEID